jgi:hypothetical protein
MQRDAKDERPVEQDDRFPSGEWKGFFLQRQLPGRHWMELHLTFRDGLIRGEGRDWVGEFLMTGRYQVSDGKCWWTKKYLKRHDVFYQGYNEGKGIWGTWEIPGDFSGGFHIWPIAMGDPTGGTLSEEAEAPAAVVVEEVVEVEEAVGAEAVTVSDCAGRE